MVKKQTKKVVSKKKEKVLEKKISEKKDYKNKSSIVLGVVSIILSVLIPYVVAITGIVGISLAYAERVKGKSKSNTWAFVLNTIGLFLSIVILTLEVLALIYINNVQI